jgi:hypothetical protein
VNFGYLTPAEVRTVFEELARKLQLKTQAVNGLVEHCHGSLEELGLSSFFDPFSGNCNDLDAAREQLEQSLALASRMKAELGELLENGTASEALAFANRVAAAREQQELTLAALRQGLMQALKRSSGDRMRELATAIFDHLETERMIAERNLSADTQLSVSMLKLIPHS